MDAGRSSSMNGSISIIVDRALVKGVTFIAYSLDDFSYYFYREYYEFS